MNRYRDTYPQDEPALKDGDGEFLGVDMRRDPIAVEPGLGAFGRNVRFDRRSVDPRKGLGLVRWANDYATPFPLQFPLVFDELGGFGAIYGAGVFADPAGTTWTMFAGADRVWITRDGFAGPVPLELPAGETIDAPCLFIQGGRSMYLFRGRDARTLRWTHGYLTSPPWYPAWTFVDDTDLVEGTLAIPDAATAVLMSDRFFVPISRDEFVASDLLEYERYAAALARFRVGNGATGERLKRLYPYGTTTLLAFTDRSIYPFLNVTGDLADMAQDDSLGELGLAASNSLAKIGTDIFFLAPNGVTTIKQAFDNKLKGVAETLSEPIQPLIDRISWRAVEGAVGAYWGDKYYLGVPLDGSSTNNAVLVYDCLKKRWCGYDDGEPIAPRHFLKAQHRGRERLLMVDYAGVVSVYEDQLEDETTAGFVPIESEFLTRGYLCKEPDEKLFQVAKLDVETWQPSYSVAAEIPGVNV